MRLANAHRGSVKRLFDLHAKQFENAVAELFRRMGYEVEQTRYVGDGGKDAIMRKGWLDSNRASK